MCVASLASPPSAQGGGRRRNPHLPEDHGPGEPRGASGIPVHARWRGEQALVRHESFVVCMARQLQLVVWPCSQGGWRQVALSRRRASFVSSSVACRLPHEHLRTPERTRQRRWRTIITSRRGNAAMIAKTMDWCVWMSSKSNVRHARAEMLCSEALPPFGDDAWPLAFMNTWTVRSSIASRRERAPPLNLMCGVALLQTLQLGPPRTACAGGPPAQVHRCH